MDLKRCDICGRVQTSWSVERDYFEKTKVGANMKSTDTPKIIVLNAQRK